MIKSIVVAHRKAGISHEKFNKYWLERHGPLAAKLIPGIRRYVQNHYVPIPGMEYEGDGIIEMWYDNIDAWRKSMEAVRSSKELAQDGASFCDLHKANVWIVEEYVIK